MVLTPEQSELTVKPGSGIRDRSVWFDTPAFHGFLLTQLPEVHSFASALADVPDSLHPASSQQELLPVGDCD